MKELKDCKHLEVERTIKDMAEEIKVLKNENRRLREDIECYKDMVKEEK